MVCKCLICDGPCRGRTYSPLIKSASLGVAQVIDGLGNPLVIPMQYAVAEYSQFVSTCRSSTGFVALPNTVLTPERVPRGRGVKISDCLYALSLPHIHPLFSCTAPLNFWTVC